MIRQLKSALLLFALMTLLTGVLYPLLVTGIAQAIFPVDANGNLIENNGHLVGSRLIGQDFTSAKYFWSRPSATAGNPYNAFDPTALTGSSGSNLGPLSRSLVVTIQQRVNVLHKVEPGNLIPIPIDMVTASASGLDPDISVAAAEYQVSRVALVRGLSEADVMTLVANHTESRLFGFIGEERVNILQLNLALDAIK